MTLISAPLAVTLAALGSSAAATALWLKRRRRYANAQSVAQAYDRWTSDQLLERLWGDHIHLGYYSNQYWWGEDFRQAKVAFVHELARWSGLDQLPPGSKVLDVGCGIGGSARILARDYGFEVLGISISPLQIERACALTPAGLSCNFAVMDAMGLQLPDASFAGVWSVEACPHMPDKQGYADELLRVLAPGGCLAVADWNRRDPADGAMNRLERLVMQQLLDQWAHPEFASIQSLQRHLEGSTHASGISIDTADWSKATLPSWFDSIAEGARRPAAILALGPQALVGALREVPTILLMQWAFATGLMQFGVFRSHKSLVTTGDDGGSRQGW